MVPLLAAACLALANQAIAQSCQSPGGALCYDITNFQPVGSRCCDGAQCQPCQYNCGTAVDWYCQSTTDLAAGAACGNKEGKCASGLTCTSAGVCGTDSASSTSSSDSSASTASTSSDSSSDSSATTASSSDASATSASDTTTAVCTANGGEVCADSMYPSADRSCCSPYTCTQVTSRSSQCLDNAIALGAACTVSGQSVGNCSDPNVCLGGVCTAPSTCILPVTGLCYSGDLNAKAGDCCASPSPSPVASFCLRGSDSNDSFCHGYNLAEGEKCGTTLAEEYRGYCASGLNCLSGVCSSDATTTTTSTTTTTTTTTTVTTVTVGCAASAATCFDGTTGTTCCTGSCVPGASFPWACP